MTSSTLIWDPATLAYTALPHDGHGEQQKNWDKPDRALRTYAARIGKPVAALRYEDYATVTREAGDPMLPGWMNPNAAGSLITTAQDYGRFLAGALRYSAEIGRQQIAINEFLGWGLGWGIERFAGKTYIWQWGDNGTAKNFVVAEPATGDAVFVFTNGAAGARVYDRLLTHATGHDHPALFWLG
jgi:hypothetical protein